MKINRQFQFTTLALIIALVFSPFQLLAAERDDQQSLEEVSVIASRLELDRRGVPQAFEVITASDINARHPTSVTELLRQAVGVNVIQQGSRGGISSLILRGGEPNFTVVLVDGVKTNDSTNTRGGSYDFSYLDVGDIERIEIIRGPMSALYGSDALSGLVSIVTRSGNAGSRAKVEVGGHGLRSAALTIGGSTGRLDGSLGLHALTENGGSPGASYDDKGIRAGMRLEVSDNTQVNGNIRHIESESTSFPEDSGGPAYAVIRDIDSREVTESHGRISLTHHARDFLRTQIAVSRYDRSERSRSPGIAQGRFNGVPPNIADTGFSRDQVTVDIAFDAPSAVSVVLGGEFQNEIGDGAGEIDVGEILATNFRLNRKTTSLFAEAKAYIGGFSLHGSIRRDDPEQIAAETTGQVGVIYDFDEGKTRLKVFWGQGFKAPSFFALGHPLVGNPDLESELGEGFNIGLRRLILNGRGRIELNLYQNEYENLIDFDPDLFTNVNRSSVSVDGAELSFNIETSASLRITGHVTYSDTKIENSTARLRGRPKWRAGGVIDWVINDRWQVVTSFLAMDDFWEVSIPTGGSFLDGYRKVDISVSYDLSESLQLAFSVDNVFGEEYQEAVGFFAPGARGRLLLEYRF